MRTSSSKSSLPARHQTKLCSELIQGQGNRWRLLDFIVVVVDPALMNICVLFTQLYSLLYHWKPTQLLLLFLWLISSFSHICLHLNLNPCLSVYSACTTTLAVFGSSTHFSHNGMIPICFSVWLATLDAEQLNLQLFLTEVGSFMNSSSL